MNDRGSSRRDGHELNAYAIYEVGYGKAQFPFYILVISHVRSSSEELAIGLCFT